MYNQSKYVINEILHNNDYTFEKLCNYFKKNIEEIHYLKKALNFDSKSEDHNLTINYIKKHTKENREELFDEICKIYRKPFILHNSSLSRVLIVNQEVFLHIVKNDKRFFKDGPERTSANIIENSLNIILGTFYPNYFPKEKRVRKKEIYDALMLLEDETDPPLIATTKLRPGTGTGKRRRKRYCLTDDGFHEIIPIITLILIDELENLFYQI
jgi:hypothetical protein